MPGQLCSFPVWPKGSAEARQLRWAQDKDTAAAWAGSDASDELRAFLRPYRWCVSMCDVGTLSSIAKRAMDAELQVKFLRKRLDTLAALAAE
jgi:hypothetical protein